jgi:hypothetical protein
VKVYIVLEEDRTFGAVVLEVFANKEEAYDEYGDDDNYWITEKEVKGYQSEKEHGDE